MSLTEKQLLRLTQKALYRGANPHTPPAAHPDVGVVLNHQASVTRAHKYTRLTALAVNRGWWLAAGKCLQQLRNCHGSLTSFAGYASRFSGQARKQAVRAKINATDLKEEIAGVFKAWPDSAEVNHKESYLAVTTGPITLFKVPLGRFKVKWDWLSNSMSAEALEPHPCYSKPHITHPHVSEGGLCMGTAENAYCSALNDYRLVDAFDLVLAMLHHYGKSPFWRLEEWYKPRPRCGNCQAYDEQDQMSLCPCGCGRYVCQKGCGKECSGCQMRFFASHGFACRHCLKPACLKCRTMCGTCHLTGCQTCLTAEEGRSGFTCPACKARPVASSVAEEEDEDDELEDEDDEYEETEEEEEEEDD